ncbi:MAG TPA: polyphenol oxidase family protein [Beutenbergiaceae bacterium]|nr:polyphenol oxidase family protein [Beutenbergiaceae bacterium]
MRHTAGNPDHARSDAGHALDEAGQVIVADLGPWATGLFTTRVGGVSAGPYTSWNLGGAVGDDPDAVRRNRRKAAGLIGGPVTYPEQVHGTDVLGPDQDEGTADAVLGRDRAVGVLVADCVPVLLAAPGMVGAVHAGRRGLLSGVVQNALAAMTEAGHPPTHAAIGPAICGSCYEVPAAMHAEAVAIEPALDARTRWGTPALDLPAGVHAALRRGGVRAIATAARCTFEDRSLFSYRRDGRTGRSAGLVVPKGSDTPS